MSNGRSSRGRATRMFDPKPGRARPRVIRTGAIFTAITLVFLWIIYTKPTILPSGGSEVKVEMANGANIRPGYTPVRVSGVEVGQVSSIERAPTHRGVLVTLHIEDGTGVEMKRDASAQLRWRTLLGRNDYIDLQPGSKSAPALGDRVVPQSRTSGQVELDEVLEPLNDNGRQALKTMLGEFNRGFGDPGQVGDTIKAVDPSLRQLAPGMRRLRGTQAGDLTNLVRSTSRMMGALSHDELALGRVVTSGRVALGVTAARRADLAGMLQEAPGAMRETRTTMVRLRSTLDLLDPLATKLRPGARTLEPAAIHARTTLRTLVPLLRDAKGTLHDLKPAVVDLRRASVAGAPVLSGFGPTLDRVSSKFLPWLNDRNPENKLKNYELVGPALASGSTATSWGDANGVVANFEAGVGESVISSVLPCRTFLTDPTVSAQDKIACELLTRAYASLLTGVAPDSPRLMPGSTVKMKILKPLLTPKRGGGR
jgi:virulence factor Mce-like protein